VKLGTGPVYPKVPTRADALAGEVRIQLRRRTNVDGKDAWGSWEENMRAIEIDTTATPRHQWHTLYHELAHAALADSGVEEILSDQIVEAVCDCIATARMRERFG
jgi:Zn-dependent peptidase ImmA (M78 family)